MQGYQTNHKDFSFEPAFPTHLNHLEKCKCLIRKVDLNKLYAMLVSKERNGKVKHRIVKLKDTPHYLFLLGDREAYQNYIKRYGKQHAHSIERSESTFDQLMTTNEKYLEGKYRNNYIICTRKKSLFGTKTVIIDGVHRACLLLHQNVGEIPAAVVDERNVDNTRQFNAYFDDYKDDFLEWYTPIEVGGRVIHERTFPKYKERHEFISNKERGKSKWDFIIERNLPDVRGKTICDLGCNVGLFSIYLSRLGAAKVDGYDRAQNVIQPSNPRLPKQNVIQQAYFVKNLFHLAGENLPKNINFFECDLQTLNFSSLKYDLLFSCCVLYHFGERFDTFIREISQNIPEVFLQTNLGHTKGQLAHYASIAYQEELLKKYGYETRIDAPTGYKYPVIYGKKKLCKKV